MDARSFIKIAFTAFSLCVCGTVRAQWEQPVIIDDNYQHYEYPLQEGAPLEFGKRPAGMGSVLFETNPKGAKIFIDDIYQGVTPLLIENVQDGTYHATMWCLMWPQRCSRMSQPD